MSRRFTSTPSSVSASKDCADRYHVSLPVEGAVASLLFSKKEVGSDLGLNHAVITSGGTKVNNHFYLKQSSKKTQTRAQ